MPDETEVVSLDAVRAAREAKSKTRPMGNCCRGVKEICGLKNPEECLVHAPYLKPDAS
jgi:hypothetical protein